MSAHRIKTRPKNNQVANNQVPAQRRPVPPPKRALGTGSKCNPTRLLPEGDSGAEIPLPSWSLTRLEWYCQTFPQRLAIDYWHLGRALNYAKEKCAQGRWTEWQAQHVPLCKDTINRARRLADEVTDPKKLDGKKWLEALCDLGILAPQTRQTIKGNAQLPEGETQVPPEQKTPHDEEPSAEVPEPQPTAGVHRRQEKAQMKPPSTMLDSVRSTLEEATNLIGDYSKQAKADQEAAREHVDMSALGEALRNAQKAIDWLGKELKTKARD